VFEEDKVPNAPAVIMDPRLKSADNSPQNCRIHQPLDVTLRTEQEFVKATTMPQPPCDGHAKAHFRALEDTPR
jgi:hypothetical protein